MLPSKTLTALQSWSSVGRWPLLGTIMCVAVSVAFNVLLFADLGGSALRGAGASATLWPAILGVPVFRCVGWRLRGLERSNARLGVVARTDSLTSCLNRGAFTAKANLLMAQRRAGETGALLMIDA